jgi:hypothetical protein
LHDTKLEKVWKSLLDRQLISHERYQLEGKINSACKVAGAAWLGSLLKNQRQVVVFGNYQKQVVEKMAALVNPGLPVADLRFPSGNLVYPKSMPDKTIDAGEFRSGILSVSGGDVETADDFQCDEAFSKMKTAIFDKQTSKYQIISAMRFGVVPLIAAGEWRADLPTEVAIRYKAAAEAEEHIRRLLTDTAEYSLMSNRVVEYAQSCSMREFTSALRRMAEESGA